jgi:uncharacterized protein YbbC (DUF1343 family)
MNAVRTGVAAIVHARAQDPGKFRWRTERYEFVDDKPAIDLLTGGDSFRSRVDAGAPVPELCALWGADRAAFLSHRERFLLYA